jgi:hypothetical protein
MVRRLVAFLVAALVMAVLGAAMHSLFVQEAWLAAASQANTGYPAALTIGDRLAWIGHDIVGMHFGTASNAPPYGLLTGIGLLIAFLAAGLVARFTGLRLIVFAVAGAVAMFVLFTALKAVLGTVGVFGARGMFGLAAQMLAGAIAGFIFARMTQPAH